MAVRGGAAGHGKSGAPLTRGCFLLVLFLLMMVMMVDAAHALSTARQPDLALGSFVVKFRGPRSALMHPTATSFSPPIKNNAGRRPPPQHLGGGSISSSLMPPGVASRTPSTRQQSPSPAAPALTPPPHALRPDTWMSGAGSRPPQPTFMGFGMDGVAVLRPAKWRHPQPSATLKEGGGEWAGMDAPAMQARQVLWSEEAHSRPKLTSGLAGPGPVTTFGRPDTFGLAISEDLSHLDDSPSGRWQTKSEDRLRSRGEDGVGSRGAPRTVFHGGLRQTRLWPTDEKEEEEELAEDESVRSLVDFNATSEYQREDYTTYHDYDQSNHSLRSLEHNTSTDHNQEHLTFQYVMDMQNLASQADLHALLEQRGITFDELRALLERGARKEDVLEFLKPPTPGTTLTTTTATNPPVLSYSPSEPAASVVEEGHPDDITRQVTLSDAETEREGDDAEQDSREQNKKNKKKGRRGKGERRRKNKKGKRNKGQRVGVSDVVPSPIPPVNNKTPSAVPDPWVPSTPRTLPETTLAPTAATRDILLPTTQPPATDTTATSPSSVKASEVSIVSVTLVEAPSDPHPQRKTTGQTTIVEGGTPSRRHNTNTTYPWEEQIIRKIPHPVRPLPGPEQTEIEEVNFVREEQRDDYVFPLRGLLIISGLMGALAVFTLVVLISYAVIKCSKKPAVNNYQVSEQQKPAGT